MEGTICNIGEFIEVIGVAHTELLVEAEAIVKLGDSIGELRW